MKGETMGFSDECRKQGSLTHFFAGVSVMMGYGVGTVSAHTRPMCAAIKAKLHELTPQSVKLVCRAYAEGKAMGLEEESFRIAERATIKAAKAAYAGANAAMGGA
jgi:hypothetical protein